MLCRICYEEDGELISVCQCSGSAGLVHSKCIEKWIIISGRKHCEICKEKYTIQIETPLQCSPACFIILGMILSVIYALFLKHHIETYPSDFWSVVTLSILVNTIYASLWILLVLFEHIYRKLAVPLWFLVFFPLSLILQSNSNHIYLALVSYVITLLNLTVLGILSAFNLIHR